MGLWPYAPAMTTGSRYFGLVMAVLLLGACAPKGTPVDPVDRRAMPDQADASERWPSWYPHAVDVRVHPASRYVKERDDLRLETRVELIDQFGEPIKDVGQFVVELRMLDEDGRIIQDDTGRQRGFRWSFDARTAESQKELWDPIARAYILPLKIDEKDADLPAFRTVLRVTFDPAWPDKPLLPTGDKARQPVEIRTDW